MGRRSFISITTINRLISIANRRARERQNMELINSQGGNIKELPPTYSLQKVDFNPTTRVAKIEILQKQNYRTIERYITQNYIKYPIYSFWKERTKTIKKTVKLLNKDLEELNWNKDNLIRQFASEIIASLNSEEYFPSWFIKEFLKKEYQEIIASIDDDCKIVVNKKNNEIALLQKQLKRNEETFNDLKYLIASPTIKLDKLKKKITKIENAKTNFLLSICTLFIYNYMKSQLRKEKLLKKCANYEDKIAHINKNINNLKEKSKTLAEEIKAIELTIKELQQTALAVKLEESKSLEEKLSFVEPLTFALTEDNTFISLKKFSGLEYEKIIGCYIIHNIKNDKYYVGQSKDVVKRMRQHFKGTMPLNIIFAEDYYNCPPDERDKLFEVKIISCLTKDELDSTERQYIEYYNSYNNGYNSTSGNS